MKYSKEGEPLQEVSPSFIFSMIKNSRHLLLRATNSIVAVADKIY